MRTNARLTDLVALLAILAVSALIYDTSGKVALAVSDTGAAALYRLWRGQEP